MGAGLLAKTVNQSKMFQLNHRIREQARSHIFGLVVSGVQVQVQVQVQVLVAAPAQA